MILLLSMVSKAVYEGRDRRIPHDSINDISILGWNMYMTLRWQHMVYLFWMTTFTQADTTSSQKYNDISLPVPIFNLYGCFLLFGDQFKFKNRFIDKKIYLNVIAKFNLVTNYPSLTWPSTICASKEGRQVVNFVPRKKLNWRGVSLFVDDYIKYSTNDSLRSDFNVALLIESKAIKTYHYQMLAEHHNNFDLIMTHDIDIYKKFITKAVFIPADTVSLRDDSWGMHHNSKKKILSHLFSDKKTSGHRLRHSVSQLLSLNYLACVISLVLG